MTLGGFHLACSTLDKLVDFAIYKFLKVSDLQAHFVTSGMVFGRKARLLVDLIRTSDHPNKATIQRAFNEVRGATKREIITHGYLWSEPNQIKFMERSISGKFNAIEHEYSPIEFTIHVLVLCVNIVSFYRSLDANDDEIDKFAKAALSLNRKSTKSPGNPTLKK
jgi:hypothetical protein